MLFFEIHNWYFFNFRSSSERTPTKRKLPNEQEYLLGNSIPLHIKKNSRIENSDNNDT